MSNYSKIGHTCPDIDKVIKQIRQAIKEAEHGIKEPDEAREYFKEIINQLDDIEGKMEGLRTANTELREYGDEQFARAEMAEIQLEEELNKPTA